MLTEYAYIKPRSQFGKHCNFRTEYTAEENIMPQPQLMHNYVIHPYTHRKTQMSKQYAVHEVQTERKDATNMGILHTEGGWPKEMNPRDPEVVQRFRRRVEKSDNWATNMRGLLSTMEGYVLQNNTIDIYQNYFDDLIATPMVKNYSIRVINSYEDPQTHVRPIRDISWSPNNLDRLAVAYGFLEFEQHSADVSPYSYVWDIENPNKAVYTLKSESPLMTVKFNPRDPVILVSGLISGQVCYWDLRVNEKPIETSHRFVSHRYPVVQTLWIPSKANNDFFSCSTDGVVLWWDIRFIKKPTESLVMDLEQPDRTNVYKAIGITALQFEQTMSSRFLAGTENGLVVNVNRRASNPVEKLAVRFHCYMGPVVAIDRNPVYTKNFLTIGDWSAKVWADDTKEGNLLSTNNRFIDLTGGCWNRVRCSVFFTINEKGTVEAYDILAGARAPLTDIRLCHDSLTAISSHDEGEFLAVGSRNGNVYLLECTQDLATFTKEDRAALSNYLERCSRYEKAIDSRLKEIRLAHRTSDNISPRYSKVKTKKKKREKQVNADKERLESYKKSRLSKPKAKDAIKMTIPEFQKAQTEYFERVEQISAQYTHLDESDIHAAQELLKDREIVKPKKEKVENEKEERKRTRSIWRIRKTRVRPTLPKEMEEERKVDVAPDSIRIKSRKPRARKVLGKICAKQVVCKPKICCADLEEKRRIRRAKKKEIASKLAKEEEEEVVVAERRRSFVIDNKWFRRLTDYVAQIPSPSPALRRRILALKDTPPSVLQKELAEAKEEARVWQERAIAKRLGSWDVERKLERKKLTEPRPQDTTRQEREEEAEIKSEESTSTIITLPTKISRRRLPPTEEELRKIEEEKRLQLWNLQKQKMKKYDKRHPYYPRISAALARMHSDETLDKRD
ncbi:dynein intermediate chain 3, ciliary-like [Frieseomelitta varia]|uniref:dynein intermediate chain 3, ciliary-like n=1 Tax=Frieseomelitta varia TaxID=561572 RepID=UPI001CB69098|nr:dynein intermediate chain 3, ciliary-like [Frieseomelitta varia]